jgi:hypothetical protein
MNDNHADLTPGREPIGDPQPDDVPDGDDDDADGDE